MKSFAARANHLTLLAWLNVALHVIGLAIIIIGMKPGTPMVSLAERLAYLSKSPPGWTIGWGVWMLCALCLIAFCAELARRLPSHYSYAAQLAVILAAAGGAIDLF